MVDIYQLAAQAGFSHCAELNMGSLVPLPEVREMCASDRCLSYGKNWACPPACGELAHNAARMAGYSRGILLQTVCRLEDDFDMEGIAAAMKLHKRQFSNLARQARLLYPGCLPLTAGACTLCRKCTCPDRPCRFPQKRFSSMEAYGLLVSRVCTESGLKYNYGSDSIAYTSCILFDDK